MNNLGGPSLSHPNNSMFHKNLPTIWRVLLVTGLSLVVLTVLTLVVRGLPGNPSSAELGTAAWSYNGPLELSPERGRLALTYSLIENHSLIFDVAVARLALPDLAINKAGEYVSLFAPAVSFIVAPGYLLGKMLGAAQVGAYAVIALFAVLNGWLLFAIARRLGAGTWAATVGALTFLFATPAFPYATTLYQHHISVFLLLLSMWILLSFRNIWTLVFVWFTCALAVVVDNPNLFLMFPVGVFALLRLWELLTEAKSLKVGRIVLSGLTTVGFVIPFVLFGWYNFLAYGDPFQLPGTLEGVSEIGSDGRPVSENTYEKSVLTPEQLSERSQAETSEKTAVSFFKTRNLYNGFYIHFLSPDRGILYFTPVILLGILGFVLLYRTNARVVALFLATIGANILLYSMWGDPWGGWAFGSRYLIPTYALLALGVALGLTRFRYSWIFVVLFVPLFVYSAWVNTLAAVTTNANPPQIQVLALEKQTGHEEKYTFMRNWEYLNGRYQGANVKSFMYQVWGKHHLSPKEYFMMVYGLVLLVSVGALVGASLEIYRKKNTRL